MRGCNAYLVQKDSSDDGVARVVCQQPCPTRHEAVTTTGVHALLLGRCVLRRHPPQALPGDREARAVAVGRLQQVAELVGNQEGVCGGVYAGVDGHGGGDEAGAPRCKRGGWRGGAVFEVERLQLCSQIGRRHLRVRERWLVMMLGAYGVQERMPALACCEVAAAGAHALEPVETLCKGGIGAPQALAVEGEGDEGVELVVVGKHAMQPGAMLCVDLYIGGGEGSCAGGTVCAPTSCK